MKFVPIEPPGTWCTYAAALDLLREKPFEIFLDVGCGAGGMSRHLLRQGKSGIGLDFSARALEIAEKNLAEFIESANYSLAQTDITEHESPLHDGGVDLGYSLMVMEHVEDDVSFIRNIMRQVRPGGHVLIAVPGRMDRWGFEDETVGHLRRYERLGLKDVMEKAGLKEVESISVAVPTANLLYGIGNFLVRRNDAEMASAPLREQTETSGIREVPFKTVFPPFFRLFINRFTLMPLLLMQRVFYRTNLGLTMMAVGRVPAAKSAD